MVSDQAVQMNIMKLVWLVLTCHDVHYEIIQERPQLILMHTERPKLYTILAFLSAIGLKTRAEIQTKIKEF